MEQKRGALFLLFLLLPLCAQAEDYRGKTITAGVFVQPPFVMPRQGGGYTGLAIDLWETFAEKRAFSTRYVNCQTLDELLAKVESGEVEAAVTSLSVLHERALVVKYSFPWYDSGLRIMVRNEQQSSFIGELFRSRRFGVYMAFFFIFLVLAALMTKIRRKKDPQFPQDLKTGFTLSLLDVVSSIRSGDIDQAYLGWLGHLLSTAWLVFGMAVVAYVTSTMTTAMAKVSIDSGEITKLGDLPGKKVGVLTDAVGQEYLSALRLDVVLFDNIEDAAHDLVDDKIQAVVTGAPTLEYWVATHPEQNLKVVGPLFHPVKYAFAANRRFSSLMDQATVELIDLHDSGVLQQLKEKYIPAQ